MTTHPEYAQEREFLATTVAAIQEALARREEASFEGGANNYTNRVLNRGLREDILARLREHGQAPYFARMDFKDRRAEQCVYFGHLHLPFKHGLILDWRCDLYSLYLGGTAPQQTYRVQRTGVEHAVTLHLKRRLDVDAETLRSVEDVLDYRPSRHPTPAGRPAPVSAPQAPATDPYLVRKLKARGDARLQDIVSTIQTEQDAIIRAPLDRPVLLHGVAGSGKTSIAYHRLAYLMFQEHDFKLQARQVLVIGPNRTFLGYVRHLLPSLGVDGIAQQTFQDWAWERLQRRRALPDATFQDRVTEQLDDPSQSGDARQRAWLGARLKGSPAFAELIARHAGLLSAQGPTLGEPLALELVRGQDRGHYHLTPAQLASFWDEVGPQASVQERRDALLSRAGQDLKEWHDRTFGPANTPADVKAWKALLKRQQDQLASAWPPLDLFDEYGQLFSLERLVDLPEGLFTPQEQRALRASRPGFRTAGKGKVTVDLSDLAGLYLLHEHLCGPATTTYRHVVIDEAQDFSPLHLQILLRACPTQAVTIVGDTAQAIHAHRGVQDWSEFTPLLDPARLQRNLIRQNYRSTRPLVTFCNALQRQARGAQAVMSQAIDRDGPKPRLVAFPDDRSRDQYLLQELKRLRAQHPSVALVVRHAAAAHAVARLLREQQVPHHLLSAEQDVTPDQLNGVTILPGALAKGLEFAAVLVPDADAEQYPAEDEYAGQVLYVAASRALHELCLLATERFTPWLDDGQGCADVDYSRLGRPPLDWAGRTLSDQLTALRRGGVPAAEYVRDIERRVATLIRDGRIEEVVAAYLTFGQLAKPTLNALLLMLAPRNPDAFIRRSFDARLPEEVRDQVADAVARLSAAGHPHASSYQQWYAHFLNPAQPAPTPGATAPAAQTHRVPLERTALLTLPRLEALLGKKRFVLPKATRKALRGVSAQLLPQVASAYRDVVRAGLEYNRFDADTLQALKAAYRALGRPRGALTFPDELR